MTQIDPAITKRGKAPLLARLVLATLALATALSLALAATASAELSFCPNGSDAGQCSEPQAVAFDTNLKRLYVADYGNKRIDVFGADGVFRMALGWGVADGAAELQSCGPQAVPPSASCLEGLVGSGAGQFASRLERIAVDNSGGPGQGDLYVFDSNNYRVEKFGPDGHFLMAFGWGVANGSAEAQTCGPEATPPTAGCQAGIPGEGDGQFNLEIDPIAVAPDGTVYVGDTMGDFSGPIRVEQFDSAGTFLKSVALPLNDRMNGTLGIDSTGNLYALFNGSPGIHKFHPDGSEYGSPYPLDPGAGTSSLAVDSADHIFAGQTEVRFKSGLGRYAIITEYDSAGAHLRRFGYGAFDGSIKGIARYLSADGALFASQDSANEAAAGLVKYLPSPPPGPVVAPLEVEPLSAKATLHAEINPEGKATTYRFEYVDKATYEADLAAEGPGHGFDHAESTASFPLGAEGFNLHHVEAEIGCPDATEEPPPSDCLTPERDYRFRVLAENPDGKGNTPFEGPGFTTTAALNIGETWSTEVGVDTAVLHAEVNPLGIPATGYFEYVDDATYQESGFEQARQVPAVGAGEAPLSFGADTAFVARSTSLYPLAPGTTYHYRLIATDPILLNSIAGPEGTLITFRSGGSAQCPTNEAFRTGPSAPLPDCRAYELVSPLDKDGGDVLVQKALHVLNQSSVSGERLAYGSYRAFSNPSSAPYASQYIAVRGEGGWENHAISPPRSQPVVEFLALSHLEFRAFSPDLCQAWLVTFADPPLSSAAVPGFSNLYRRQDESCGAGGYEALSTIEPPNAASHVAPRDQYIPLELQGLSADGERALFVTSDSLPGTGAPPQPADCATKGSAWCHLELYEWSATNGIRFACLRPDASPSPSCTAGAGPVSATSAGSGEDAHLDGAFSADGSRIFWTDSAGGAGRIYVSIDGQPSVPVSKKAEEESGISGSRFRLAARDGSKAVFTAGEDLYEFDVDAEATRLIAHKTLPGKGTLGSDGSGPLGASEDGSRVYFSSKEVLTETPNSEGDKAQADKPNLYLYHAGAYAFIGTLSDQDISRTPSPISEQAIASLARVSPDGLHATFMSTAALTGYENADAASGKADTEVFLYDATADGGAGKLLCASCNPSGARPAGADTGAHTVEAFWVGAKIPPKETVFYGPRVLSDDGKRLFFESSDALVARDTNGRQDVYEWEAVGRGDCAEGNASFSTQAEGCIDLISSGQSPLDSKFLDASPSGGDAFFTTGASLLPQDYGLVDVYDAKAGGGFPPESPPPPACEGEACQGPLAPPNDPTPASSSYEGPGNPRLAKKAKKAHKKIKRKKHNRSHQNGRAHHERKAKR